MGSSASCPRKPELASGRASLVISTLADDPHGQFRAPSASQQTVCDVSVWDTITELVSSSHALYEASPAGSSPPPAAREGIRRLLVELGARCPELRFKSQSFWVDYNTDTVGHRLLDPDLNHWEHVVYVANPSGPRAAQSDDAAGSSDLDDVPAVERRNSQESLLIRPLPPLDDPRRAIGYQDFWLQRGILRHQPLEPLPPKLREYVPRWNLSTKSPRNATPRADTAVTRQMSQPSWLPQEWEAVPDATISLRGGVRDLKRRLTGGASQVRKLHSEGCLPALRARKERCYAVVARLCAAGCQSKAAEDPLVRPPPRRWYRLYPLANELQFFVRPDAGLRGRQPGFVHNKRALGVSHYAMASSAQEANAFREEFEKKGDVHLVQSKWKGGLGGRKKIQLSWSVPNFVERQWMLESPPGFQCDVFRNCCRICYEQPSELVVLPCRHGGLCEECLRLTFLSRPKHRGGRNCPFCRRVVTEVIQIYRDSYGPPQYAFAIQMQ